MENTRREPIRPPLWVITTFLLILFGWLLYELKEMVALLVIGYCFAYLMMPALKFLQTRKISRPAGFFIIFGLILLFVLLLMLTAIPTIFEEYKSLSSNFPIYVSVAREKATALILNFSAYLPANIAGEIENGGLSSLMPALTGETLNNILAGVGKTLLRGYSITLTIVNLALLPFIIYYIAIDFEKIHNQLLMLIPAKHQENVKSIAVEINTYISAFVRGQMLVGLILLALYALGLGIVGVELWFLLAVVAGLGNMIPYLGTAVGVVLSSIMALVTFGDFPHLLAVWFIFFIVQFLEGTFITPKIVGDKVGLSPLIVILALFAGGSLFGIIGIMLAVPGAATLRVLGRNLLEWISKSGQGLESEAF
ncbi:MAG: AI-2E family transporter [Bdellovibrionota bacterium]